MKENELLYEIVLELVKKGLSIQDACRKIKISRSYFYRNTTKEQKRIIKSYKSTMRVYGVNGCFSRLNHKDFITLNDEEDV